MVAPIALYGVLVGLEISRFPPFVDEALYAEWTQRTSLFSPSSWIALQNGKEPLLTWIGSGIVHLGASPLTAVEIVSALSGALLVILVALLANELAGRPAALTAATMAAIAPFFVVHDAIGIMEPLLGAATTAALYLQIRLVRRPTVGTALLLALAFALALLTKRSGWLAVALLPGALLAIRDRSVLQPRPLARLVALAGGAAAIGWAAGVETLRLSPLFSTYEQNRNQLGSYHSVSTGLREWRHWVGENLHPFLSSLSGYLTITILVLAALGLVSAVRRREALAALFLLWALGVLAAAVLLAENAYPRYVYGLVPPLLAVAGQGAAWLWEGRSAVPGRLRRPVVAVVAGVALLVPGWADARFIADAGSTRYPGRDDQQFATGWAAGNAWVALAHEVHTLGDAGDGATCFGSCSLVPEWVLAKWGFHLVDPTSAGADSTPLVIVSATALPTSGGVGQLRRVWQYHRPRGGDTLDLYERLST